MRTEINWGFALNLNSEVDFDMKTLKNCFGENFILSCEKEGFEAKDLFEVVVCGKVWANLDSDEDFFKRKIAKLTANQIKNHLNQFGNQILYSRIIRDRVFSVEDFAHKNHILDVSVDKIVKCYKKPGGSIRMKNVEIKYDIEGFESIDAYPTFDKSFSM